MIRCIQTNSIGLASLPHIKRKYSVFVYIIEAEEYVSADIHYSKYKSIIGNSAGSKMLYSQRIYYLEIDNTVMLNIMICIYIK